MKFTPAEVLLEFHLYSPLQKINMQLKENQTRILYLYLQIPNNKIYLNKIINYLFSREQIREKAFTKLVENKKYRKNQYDQGVNCKSSEPGQLVLF